jgi:hypothetical protein
MCLVKYYRPCLPGDPTQEEFCFKEVKVANEIITGEVYNRADVKIADLGGTCCPFDARPNLSRMTFFFFANNNDGVPIEIMITGWGFQPQQGAATFFGGFVVLKPLSLELAPPGPPVNFDEGDTGTGTGMQADCVFPTPT